MILTLIINTALMINKLSWLLCAVLFLSLAANAYDIKHVQQLQKTGHCEGCDLTGIRYVPGFKPKSPPTISDLSHANIVTDLATANLQGADLSGAELSGLSLENAVLTGAKLVNARLVNTNLKKANLQAVNLKGAILTDADLSNANLIDTLLIGTDFSGANLSGARFGVTDPSLWDLPRYPKPANYSYANLSGVKNFPTAGWEYSDSGSYYCNTRMPSGIRVRYDC
jgi:uncharacterized protein YjbI with pentapeptide repeats